MSVKKQCHRVLFFLKLPLFPVFRHTRTALQRVRIFQVNPVLHRTELLLRQKLLLPILPQKQIKKRENVLLRRLLPVIDQQKHILHISGHPKR